jgi:NADPH-dependent curcumin reductase CurA
MKSREVQLVGRPPGMPTPEDFQVVETELGYPGPGEVLVRNLFLSVDPYMRGRMRDRKSYVAPYGLGATMTGGAVGQVLESHVPDLLPGDHVLSNFGWREAFCCAAGEVTPLGDLQAPPSAYLGVMGMPGMTAYTGLFGAASLEDGETVFVSGAAGAVGSIAGQIAKIKGCRVVGTAGSAEKVRYLVDELGFDHAFDYHDGRLSEQIREGAPDGVDVFFDNISMYNDTEAAPGPTNLPRAIGLGLNIRGFLVRHYRHMRDDFLRDVGGWLADGTLTYRETVYEGIESASDAFIGLFTGANIGKMVVRIGDAD